VIKQQQINIQERNKDLEEIKFPSKLAYYLFRAYLFQNKSCPIVKLIQYVFLGLFMQWRLKWRLLFFSINLIYSLDLLAAEPEFYRLKINSKRWEVSDRTSFLEGKISREILLQLDSIYEKYPGDYEFDYSPTTQTLKVFIQCSLDFYSIKEGQLLKDYQFNNRGYTCGSSLFFQNNTYHILGGKGFWMNHMDLMQFDSINGSWEFIQIKNQPQDYFPTGIIHAKKGAYALFGEYNDPRIPRLEKEPFGYFLDYAKKTWQPISVETEGFNLSEIIRNNPSYLYETEDYGFIVSNTQLPSLGWNIWVLVEKDSGKLFVFEGNKNFELVFSPFKEVIGNQIRYFDYKVASATEGKEVRIDLDSIRSKSREFGQLTLLEPKEETSTFPTFTSFIWIGFPFVFFFALWMGIQIQKRKNAKKPEVQTSEKDADFEQENEDDSEALLQQLLGYDGEKLSTEAFDVLLGIDQITNFDSKRIKRSRLIKSINKNYEEKKGYPLITRIKNPEDKRFVFYKISFESGS
jgi:hypothetical protein